MTITIASTTNTLEEIQSAAADPVKPEIAASPEAPPTEVASPEAEPETQAAPADPEAASPVAESPDEVEEPVVATPEADAADKNISRTRKKDLQARIDELVRDKYTSQRAAIDAQNEVLRLREELEGRRAQPRDPATEPAPEPEAKPTAVEDPEPQSNQFETFEEYVAAYAKHAARKERRELETQILQQRKDYERAELENRRAFEMQRARQSNDTLMAAHLARVDAIKESIPDFDDVLDKSENLELAPPMRSVILNEEHGPRLMYYLAQHPEECERIAQLAPTPQLVAMGKLLTKIENEIESAAATVAPTASATVKEAPAKKAAAPSKLPPPPKTVGSGSAQSSKPLDELSYAEFREIRNREERARMSR